MKDERDILASALAVIVCAVLGVVCLLLAATCADPADAQQREALRRYDRVNCSTHQASGGPPPRCL